VNSKPRHYTPVDPDTVPVRPDGTAAAVTEVPEELSFRTPYFFPGANGGWAAEGDDPAPPERPGRGCCSPTLNLVHLLLLLLQGGH
jgi:hypothetical protein